VDEVTGFALVSEIFTSLPWASGDDQAYPLDVTTDGSIAVAGELCDDGNLQGGDGREGDCTPTP
jgi:cysteine-rich repeat protein